MAADYTSDVLVVGAGNAALCAALAIRERGVSVILIESAPIEERGGNSRYTGGALRMVYNGVEDLEKIYADLTEDEKKNADFGTYTAEQFFDDMGRITQYRTNPDLCEVLVTKSFETYAWMKQKGVKFMPIYGRQAFKIDGKFKFWGGIAVESWGGGEGLVNSMFAAAERDGAQVLYHTRATALLQDDAGAVCGVKARKDGRAIEIRARQVILACGGFQSNTEWRTRYLGPGWDLAKVRGTRYNLGDGHRMAIEIGAMPYGQWSGCHAVGWDYNAPDFGDLTVGDAFQKHSYPFALMVNAQGRRFVDEGADFRNYTYAKYGRAILEQPGQYAWQIWDQKTVHLQRDEYKIRRVTKVKADTLAQLAAKLDPPVDQAQFLKTIAEYNATVMTEVPYNPNVKDGRGTRGLALPKSNWAMTIDQPPFEAYAVTCGVTFTFGGLRVNTSAQVLDTEEKVIPGLYAAGEIVGGLFYFNYPGGSGLTAGAVFGKIAGEHAAAQVAATAAAKKA
ncbi:MAG: FAD-dependent tricarballylate dehydrogenase TcuA [Candidatus Lambdaproteobacteria bacterium]|nr:FAD-dependent tricarballylate dehydrogenase TcuA [Candidatus Lambdaproteobacteria bacterium]